MSSTSSNNPHASLLQPGRIGKMELKNRIVMAPMGENFGGDDGLCGEKTQAYYEERAAGGTGLLTSQARKRVRPALSVAIGGALTQDGVTGAVLEARVEGDLTLKQAMRILLAHAAGNATGLEGTSPEFRVATDSGKTRIAGTYAGGTRTVTTLDGS